MKNNNLKQSKISLKNVVWGSEEFNKLIKQAEKEKRQLEQYEQEVEAIKIIQGY